MNCEIQRGINPTISAGFRLRPSHAKLLVSVAKEYLHENRDIITQDRGYVVIWGGVAFGWKSSIIDRAPTVRPGVFAVPVHPNASVIFEADGGDYANGAKQWRPVFFLADPPDDSPSGMSTAPTEFRSSVVSSAGPCR